MTDQPPVTITHAPPGKYTVTASNNLDLTDREMSSLAKVASYRGLVGKQAAEIRRLKAGIRDALDQLRPEEPAFERLSRALAEPSQEDA